MTEMFLMLKSDQLTKLKEWLNSCGELEDDYSTDEIYDQRIFELLEEYFTTMEVFYTPPEELEQSVIMLDDFVSNLVDQLLVLFKTLPTFRVVEIYENKVLLALKWREPQCSSKAI